MKLGPGMDPGFSFLSIFKWEERKGWPVLLTAYFSEFSLKDDVVLFLLTKSVDHSANCYVNPHPKYVAHQT